MIAGSVAAIIGFAALIYVIDRQSGPVLGTAIANEGADHVAVGTLIEYDSVPPASGPHYPSPQPWGVYDQMVAEGFWVHNLEHGGIVLLYKCAPEDCAAEADKIRTVADTLPESKFRNIKFLATPYEQIDTPYMLVAWDRQLPMETFDEQLVRDFYDDFVDRGPEDVP